MAKTAQEPAAPKSTSPRKVKKADRVHFVDRSTKAHHEAIVMALSKDGVPDLEIIPAGGTTFAEKACAQDEDEKKPGTWHFIER